MKERDIKIIGKMDEEKKRELAGETDRELEEEYRRIISLARKSELIKNEGDLRTIERINFWLGEYFRDADIEEFRKISPEQFIFLSQDDFIKFGWDVFNKDWSDFPAKSILLLRGIILINRSLELNRFAYIAGLLHEAIHIASEYKSKILYKKKTNTDGYEDDSGSARTGYSIRSVKKEVDGEDYQTYEYFEGLNEAIIQLTTFDILTKHKEELFSEFNITEEEKNKFRDGYGAYEHIFVIIAKRVAKNLGISPKDYWLRFKKNLFVGNLMFLRDIERTFGRGSLRVLAFLGSSSSHAYDQDLIGLFEKYFTSDDMAERNQIADKIFDGEGDKKYLEKYKRRRND